MSRQIVINAGIREKRAAILEDNSLDDMLFERDTYEQIARNIYRARVKDVLPGMQAAFVDIGIEKNAFLHISDTFPLVSSNQLHKWKKNQLGIQHIVQPGQEIMVQVIKEPIGSKGPKVTCKVTLPGRYFVYLPYEKKIGISRRISEENERNRLKQIARDFTNNNGVIVRTNAAGKGRKTLIHDYKYLHRVWGDVKSRYYNSKAPALVYRDVELMKLIVRDYLSPDIDRVIVDDKNAYNSLLHLADIIVPDLKNKITHYRRTVPIFDYYGIEKELSRVLQRKVWLKSGGYVIFDTTEALISIDVNTGKYIGKKNLQETVYKTNVEAAREIARQLRLRDIGGIIIIDFIDMNKKKHREGVLQVMEESLSRDRTKTSLLGLTKLGLVEMTRKKVREGMGELVQKECPYCEGTGRVLSESTMALKVVRKIREMAMKEDYDAFLLEVHPEVAAVLIGVGGEKLEELEKRLNKDIYIKGNNKLHMEDYNIVKKGSKQQLKELALPVKKGGEHRVRITEKHVNNPDDGIARIKGYIIIVKNGGHLTEQEVEVRIREVQRTFAKAEII